MINSDIPFYQKLFLLVDQMTLELGKTYELGPGSRNTGLEYNTGSF